VLNLERLEDRTLLAVTVTPYPGNAVGIQGTVGDQVWLQTNNVMVNGQLVSGVFQYSTDGTNYSNLPSLGGIDQLVTAQQPATITLGDMDKLHVVNVIGQGHAITLQALGVPNGDAGQLASPTLLTVEGTVYTAGGDLSVLNMQGIEVESGVTVATCNIGSSTGYLTAPAAGNSGSITFTSENQDFFNPVFNVNFVAPHVTLDSNVQLLADANNQGGTNYTAGNVTLSAQNTNYSLEGVAANLLAAVSRNASITISNGDTIQGNEVSATVNAGDITPTVGIEQADSSTKWGPWVAGIVNDVIAVGSSGLTLPVTFVYKQADASLTVGSAQITADDAVTLTAVGTAEAPARAASSSDSSVGVSVGFGDASATATTELQSGATIKAGGNVTVSSEADAANNAEADTQAEDGTNGGQLVKFAVAINLASNTSHTTLDAGSMINAKGSVSVASGSATFGRSDAETGYSPNGEVGQSIGVGIKNSDVKTIVDGTIISDAPQINTQALTFNPFTDVNFATSTIHIPKNGFTAGEPLVYSSGDGGSIPGLKSGVTYYVIVVDPNDIQLAASAAGPAITFTPYPTLAAAGGATLAITNTGETTDTFSNNPGWTTGQAVVYHAAAGQLIGGLTNGQTYYVSVDPGDSSTFRLATSAANASTIASAAHAAYTQEYNADIASGEQPGTAIPDAEIAANTAAQGTGDVVQINQNPLFTWTGGSGKQSQTFTFDPTTDSITFAESSAQLAQQGLTNGMALTYSAALGLSFANLTDGATYYAVVDPSSTGSTTRVFLVGSASAATTVASAVQTAYSQAKSQLASGSATDPNFPANAVVGAALETQDTNGNYLVINLSFDDTVMTGATNTVTPVPTGIDIAADLSSYDEVDAGSTNDQEPSNKQSLLGSNNAAAIDNSFGASKNKLLGVFGFGGSGQGAQNVANKTGSSAPQFSYSGALVFDRVNNTALAEVGRTAVLQTSADLSVKSALSETSVSDAEASVAPQDAQNGSKISVSTALTVILFTNNCQALVEDGAALDASGALTVSSSVKYPFNGPVGVDPGSNADAYLQSLQPYPVSTVGALAPFLNGALGVGDIINNWGQATAEGAKVSAAGVVTFLDYTTTDNAILGWQDPNAPAGTYSASQPTKIDQNAAFQQPGQSVSVTSATTIDFINVGGNFDLGVTPDELVKAVRKSQPTVVVNPTGAAGQKGGIGGTVLVLISDSTTEAEIGPNVELYTDPGGGLSVNASTNIINVTLGQAGADGGTFGFAGTGMFTDFQNTTLAHINSGANIVGPVAVAANDTAINVTVAGGVVAGQSLGFGITVAVNDMVRDTEASIGDGPNSAATTINTSGGALSVSAQNSGTLVAVSYAASDIGPAPPTSAATTNSNAQGAANSAQSLTGSGSKGAASPGGYGIGVSGDVALNGYGDASAPVGITDTVKAYINTPGIITAGSVTISAQNDMDLYAAAGAVAIAHNKSGTNAGLAGSYSQNTLLGDTEAYIDGVVIVASSLSVTSERTGDIFALTAGAAGATTQKGLAAAGSVSINSITNTTKAYLFNDYATVSGSVAVTATDQSLLWVIAGGLAYGGKAGVGAAIADNELNLTTSAYLDSTSLTQSTGTFSVEAANQPASPS
jgi:hypothetical protein